jgi:hypothetical protein
MKRLSLKQQIQIVGGAIVLSGLLGGRGAHPSRIVFLVGAAIFLSTFITWKPKKGDD